MASLLPHSLLPQFELVQSILLPQNSAVCAGQAPPPQHLSPAPHLSKLAALLPQNA